MAALEKIQPTLPRSSVAGITAAAAVDQFSRAEAIEHKMPGLQKRVERVDTTVANALTPRTFRGNEVAGRAVVVELAGPVATRGLTLAGELQRTISMVETGHEVIAQLASSHRGLDEATVAGAREN